jgi:hypothetical protein
MKILIANNVRGDFYYLNQQIINNQIDIAILIGMTGIHRGNRGDDYLFNLNMSIDNYDLEYIKNDNGNFSDLVLGKIKLNCPVYVYNYIAHNGFLVNELITKKIIVNDFVLAESGICYSLNKDYDYCSFAGLGGTFINEIKHYDNYCISHNGFGFFDIKRLLSLPSVDLLFLSEPFGGRLKNWDLTDTYKIDDKEFNLYDINKLLNVKITFFGGNNKIIGEDFIDYADREGNVRRLCWCRSMKEVCYLYDTESKELSYV